MRSQTRIVVIVAAALVAAALAASVYDPTPSPTDGTAAAATSATAILPRMRRDIEAAVAAIDTSGESTADPTPNQRTAIVVGPSRDRIPVRDEERVRMRAAAAAKELELGAADETALLEVLIEEQARRAGVFAELRRMPDDAGARARVRTELDSIRTWKGETLRDLFGAECAEALARRR